MSLRCLHPLAGSAGFVRLCKRAHFAHLTLRGLSRLRAGLAAASSRKRGLAVVHGRIVAGRIAWSLPGAVVPIPTRIWALLVRLGGRSIFLDLAGIRADLGRTGLVVSTIIAPLRRAGLVVSATVTTLHRTLAVGPAA